MLFTLVNTSFKDLHKAMRSNTGDIPSAKIESSIVLSIDLFLDVNLILLFAHFGHILQDNRMRENLYHLADEFLQVYPVVSKGGFKKNLSKTKLLVIKVNNWYQSHI